MTSFPTSIKTFSTLVDLVDSVLASHQNEHRDETTAIEGFLLGGKISVTVSANDITVALKSYDGGDPSATEPVWVRIGTTWRSVTAALSVTLADGTQWFGLGTPFATLEQQFFAYLGWRAASSAVVIGFARIPYATVYSDFSATTTNEKHGAFSTAPASTDDVVVVGRFSATLSATAAFNWSVPTFTSSNLIQRPIYETDWMSWLPAPTGFSAVPTNTVYRYRIVGKMVEAEGREASAGTSNATTTTWTAPFTAITLTNMSWTGLGRGSNNSANLATTVIGNIASAAATINFFIDPAATAWTGSGTKSITQWRIWYQIA